MSRRGAQVEVKRRVARDRRTGREVWAVSPEGARSGAVYMYVRCFSPDERHLFYESDVSGSLQVHRLEIETGLLTQMTDAEGVGSMRWNLHPGGRDLFYVAGGRYFAVDVGTLEEREVLDPAARGWKAGGIVMFSGSGRWFSLSYTDADGRVHVARATCDGADVETLHRREEGEGVQHLMFCNAGDDLMSFSPAPDHQQEWDAPWERRARTYLLDAATGRVEPFLVLPRPFTSTHDYWSPDGSRLYFHRKTRPTWTPTWISSMDRLTREATDIYRSDTLKLGHSFVTRDERRIVSDVQEPDDNPLLLIERAGGAAETLCWPDSKVAAGHGGYSHVHPSFSPSGRFVVYTSDVSGRGQVYLVPLAPGPAAG